MTNLAICEEYFEKTELEFFDSISEKKNYIVDRNKQINLKRAEILGQIEKNKTEKSIFSSKDSREYINGTEAVLESIDEIVRNYTKLSNRLYDIEKALIILSEKEKFHVNYNLATDVDLLKQKVSEAKDYENKVEDENKKYEIVVDNYFSTIFSNYEENENKVIDYIKDDNEELKDNLVLRVSEIEKKVYLPYTKNEVESFLKSYPNEYENARDVIEKEFTASIDIYNRRPSFARFREGYSLCRNKEMMSVIDSFKFGLEIMFRNDLNPAIVAAVKNKKQLEDYIECIEKENLESFKYFKILFEVAPLKNI